MTQTIDRLLARIREVKALAPQKLREVADDVAGKITQALNRGLSRILLSRVRRKLRLPQTKTRPPEATPLAGRAALRQELEGIAKQRAEHLKRTLSNKERGPVLTILKDEKTGQTFDAINVNTVPDDLHPILKNRVDGLKDPVHPSDPGTHAEIIAIDKALKAREAAGMPVTEADLSDFVLYNETLYRNRTGSVPCCANCTALTDGVESLSGKLTTWEERRR